MTCAVFLAEMGWQDANGVLARHIRVDSSGDWRSSGDTPNHSLGIAERIFLPLYACFFVPGSSGWS